MYGRSGEACHRCGTTVRMRRQSDDGRSTYFCPACQPTGAGPAPTGGASLERTSGARPREGGPAEPDSNPTEDES